jgi:hypothetical protein
MVLPVQPSVVSICPLSRNRSIRQRHDHMQRSSSKLGAQPPCGRFYRVAHLKNAVAQCSLRRANLE